MPFQGADLTSSTLQKTANPSSKWSSTYHSMYQHPSKYTQRTNYWLKRGVKRTEYLKQQSKQGQTLGKSASSQLLSYEPTLRSSAALGASIPLSVTRPQRRSEPHVQSYQARQVYDAHPLSPQRTVIEFASSQPKITPQSIRRSQSLPASLSVRPIDRSSQKIPSHMNIVYEPDYNEERDEYLPTQSVYEPAPHQQIPLSTQTWIRPESSAYRTSPSVRQTQQLHNQTSNGPKYEPYPLYTQAQLKPTTPYSSSQQAVAWQ